MYKHVARAVVLVVALSLIAGVGSARLNAQAPLTVADAKTWMGDWVLTIMGGRGPQERPLTFKDMGGKVAATLGGGRGGEVDVTLTLTMEADGTLKVVNQAGENKQEGTGKKKA